MAQIRSGHGRGEVEHLRALRGDGPDLSELLGYEGAVLLDRLQVLDFWLVL